MAKKPFVYKRGQCFVCGQPDRPVCRNRKSGKLICLSCKSAFYDKQPRRLKTCGHCAELKFVRYWYEKEQGRVKICADCYQELRDREACSICQQDKPVTMRLANGSPVCSICYHRVFLQARCIICGEVRRIEIRLGPDEVICHNCCGTGKHHHYLKDREGRPAHD